jgi:very-short-patch-repair endonuclease
LIFLSLFANIQHFWLGYTRKDNAKANFIKCNFVKGLDYEVSLHTTPKGGRPTEIIKITIECFVSWVISSKKSASSEILYLLKSVGYQSDIKVRVNTRLELSFKEILFSAISWKTLIITQYYVKVNSHKYFIDFYLPDYHLAIEYDEKDHSSQLVSDELRQAEIESYLGCKFIRVYQGKELVALTKILKVVFDEK